MVNLPKINLTLTKQINLYESIEDLNIFRWQQEFSERVFSFLWNEIQETFSYPMSLIRDIIVIFENMHPYNKILVVFLELYGSFR